MPRLVALARSAIPSSASSRLSHGSTFTTGPTASAISCAFSRVRLARRISFAPCAARLATTARAAPPAPSTTIGAAVGTPLRIGVTQALDETVAVVVESGEHSVLFDDDRVDRADAAREVVDAVEQREDRLLVRRGDVAAAQAERGDAAHRRFEIFRRHRNSSVASGNAILRKPMVVDDRRARVRHRPPQKARNTERVLFCHRLIFPLYGL